MKEKPSRTKEPRTQKQPAAVPSIKKKLRSKLPLRRARDQISPIIWSVNEPEIPAVFPVDSSSCMRGASCDSSRVSFVKSKAARNGQFCDTVTELSESSCVESSGHRIVARSFKSKKRGADDAAYNSGPGISINSAVDRVSVKNSIENARKSLEHKGNQQNDNASLASGAYFGAAIEVQESFRGNNCDASYTVSNSESTIDQKTKSSILESDLACCEQLLLDDFSVSVQSLSQETLLSELQLENFPDSSDYFSDYTESLFSDTGSEFSERSSSDSTPSLAFSLLAQYRKQFTPSTALSTFESSPTLEDGFMSVRFEDKGDEESYQLLRKRERRQVFLRNYATEYGDLVFKRRSEMVSWIVEQSSAKEFQQETVFLGVSLLDRFLSKGFFKLERNFHIVGIACLTLATRIEENQPYNSVRQKNFYIGSNVYSRCEVVAMEWLVQEVLNFQCFLPTIYNFLWFYLKAARANADLEKRAKYLAVAVLLNSSQLCYWPSTVAAAVVILSSVEGNRVASYQRVIEAHVRTKNDDLRECFKSLAWLVEYL